MMGKMFFLQWEQTEVPIWRLRILMQYKIQHKETNTTFHLAAKKTDALPLLWSILKFLAL